MHDIGKIGIPDSILLKPGPLTGAEQALMRTHPEKGHAILKGVPPMREAAAQSGTIAAQQADAR